MTIILVMAVIFFIISIFLFQGKGSWMISGYNTASKEEKAKYDEKKVCKATGGVCLVVAIGLCAMAYLGHRVDMGIMEEKSMLPFALIFIAVVVGAVAFNIYYTNKKCKK